MCLRACLLCDFQRAKPKRKNPSKQNKENRPKQTEMSNRLKGDIYSLDPNYDDHNTVEHQVNLNDEKAVQMPKVIKKSIKLQNVDVYDFEKAQSLTNAEGKHYLLILK